MPGKVRRELTDDELTGLRASAQTYVELAQRYAGETNIVATGGDN